MSKTGKAKSIESIADLTPDPRNARKHNPRNIKLIQDSLHDVGAARSIVIDENGVILAGNGVTEAANLAGIEKVQVVDADGETLIAVRRSGLTAKQKKKLALADNRATELSEWDTDVLAEIAAQDGDLLDGLFDENELAELIGQGEAQEETADVGELIDKAAELQKKWQVSRGDVWEIGKHRLMCGDSTSAEDVAKLMGGERAAFCFTSPPYADQRDYKGDDLSITRIVRFVDAVADRCELFAVNLGLSRKNGFVSRYWDDYIAKFELNGLGLLSWNVWNREGMGGTVGQMTAMFPIEHEFIFVFGKRAKELNRTRINKSAGTRNNSTIRQREGHTEPHLYIAHDLGKLGTVLTCDVLRGKKEHPAMFPLNLPKSYIEACTARGDVVYEPFSGAGTTLAACETLERRGMGAEIAPEYCAVTLERLSLLGLTPKRLENDRQF